MNHLFDTQPIKGLKPDGRIERRGRPLKTDAHGRRICTTCSAPVNQEGKYDKAKVRKSAFEEAIEIVRAHEFEAGKRYDEVSVYRMPDDDRGTEEWAFHAGGIISDGFTSDTEAEYAAVKAWLRAEIAILIDSLSSLQSPAEPGKETTES